MRNITFKEESTKFWEMFFVTENISSDYMYQQVFIDTTDKSSENNILIQKLNILWVYPPKN